MKKKIITAAILLVLGICAITAGVFLRPLTRSYDVAGLTDDMLGKTVNLCVTGESLGTFVDYVEETGMFTSDYKDWYYSSDDGTIIRITVAEEHRDDIRLEKIYENNMTLTGTVRKASDDMVKETGDRLMPDMPIKLEEYLDKVSPLGDRCLFLGDGMPVHRERIRDMMGEKAVFAPPHLAFLRPAAAAFLAWRRTDEAVAYQDLKPLYLRPPQVERQRNLKERPHG